MGSRHLQGLLKCSYPQKIFVLDPSPTSLELAKHRSQEIDHNHQLSFVDNWNDLPESFDLVIVATNSDVREQAVSHLAENYEIKYLILEKVLFQEIDAYSRVAELLNKHQISTWVNHPRRMFSSYKKIRSLLTPGSQKIIQFFGGNWGLGSNSLHLIDLCIYLADSDLISLDTDWVDSELIPCKRKGFIEFTGIITGKLADYSTFQLTSLKGETTPGTMTIFDSDTRMVIQELGTPQIYFLQKEKMFKADSIPFEMEMQSSLTKRLVEELYERGNCDLPSYKQACKSHVIFIREMLRKYSEIKGGNHIKLPVT